MNQQLFDRCRLGLVLVIGLLALAGFAWQATRLFFRELNAHESFWCFLRLTGIPVFAGLIYLVAVEICRLALTSQPL